MDLILSDYRSPLRLLRLQWLGLALMACLFFLGGFLGLRALWGKEPAVRWMFLSGATGIYLFAVLWSGLPLNRRPGEMLLMPVLGPGNLLTLLRGLLTAALAGFLFSPLPPAWLAWLPGILYTGVGLADLFDGYLARRTNTVTRLGERLDMSLDGLGVLVGSALLVQYGQVPLWYLSVGLARYLFLAGCWLLRKRGRQVHDLPPSPARRPLAGAQMGFIGVLLFPFFAPPGTHFAAALFALPFLAGFTLDFLAASGMLRTPLPPTGVFAKAIGKFVNGWGTLGLRLAVVLTLGWVSTMQLFELPPGWLFPFLALAVPGSILLVLGAAGRVASLATLFALGIQARFLSITPADLFVLTGVVVIFYLGTGSYSIWKPEQRLITRRLGEA